jgi:hypothetical protein
MKEIAEIVKSGDLIASILDDFKVFWSETGRKKLSEELATLIEDSINPDGPACLATGQITYQCLLLKDDLEKYGNGVALNLLVSTDYGVQSDVMLESDEL